MIAAFWWSNVVEAVVVVDAVDVRVDTTIEKGKKLV